MIASRSAILDDGLQADIIQLIRRVSRQELMPRFRALDPASIQTKSRFDDLVTDADLAVEAALGRGLRDLLPSVRVLGEESVAARPELLATLHKPGVTAIIDPIDGTWNFANGVSNFGVLVSLVDSGTTEFGVLYDPVMDDWLASVRNQGTRFHSNDGHTTLAQTRSTGAIADMVGFMQAIQFPEHDRDAAHSVTRSFARCHTLRCACHEYRLLAMGAVDFVIHAIPTPWDFSAGALAVSEAGGAVGFADGRDYSPAIDDGYLIAAGNANTLTLLRAHLAEHGLHRPALTPP